MEDPIRSLEDEDVVVEVQSDVNEVRTYVNEVLPDARMKKLFSGTIQWLKFEIACIAAKGQRKHMQDDVVCSELHLGENYGNPGTSVKRSPCQIM